MKKHTAQIATQPKTKPARVLFGLSSDDLQAVYGGGGVIINPPKSGGNGPG